MLQVELRECISDFCSHDIIMRNRLLNTVRCLSEMFSDEPTLEEMLESLDGLWVMCNAHMSTNNARKLFLNLIWVLDVPLVCHKLRSEKTLLALDRIYRILYDDSKEKGTTEGIGYIYLYCQSATYVTPEIYNIAIAHTNEMLQNRISEASYNRTSIVYIAEFPNATIREVFATLRKEFNQRFIMYYTREHYLGRQRENDVYTMGMLILEHVRKYKDQETIEDLTASMERMMHTC
jgi:hypothetical protein